MIKPYLLAATLCSITTATAMVHANEHEQMMRNMMLMQRCLSENVDMRSLAEMGAHSEKMTQQIKQLCASGKRQHAQDSALAYAKDMQNNPNVQAMQKCAADIDNSLPSAQVLQKSFTIEHLKENHVCDEL